MDSPKNPLRIILEGVTEEVVVPLHACGYGYMNPGCKIHPTALRADVTRICDFFPKPGDAKPAPWFDVADGLRSIAGIRRELEEQPDYVCDAERSRRDLDTLERVLQATSAARFRLSLVTRAEQRALPDPEPSSEPLAGAVTISDASAKPPSRT